MRPLTRVRFGFVVLWRSLQVVATNRQLIVFPVLSWAAFVGSIVAIAATISDASVLPGLVASVPAVEPSETVLWVLGLADPVVAFLVGAVATTFFNAAMVYLTIRTLREEPVRLRDGVGSAFGVIEHVVVWGVLTSSIDVVFHLLERLDPTETTIADLPRVPRVSTAFLFLPVLVFENVSLRRTFERSERLFEKRWGESRGAGLGIDLVLSIIAAVTIGVIAFVQFDPTVAPADPITVAGVVVLAVVLLLRQMAVPIAKAGLYVYAATGESPPGFEGLDFADVSWGSAPTEVGRQKISES